MGDAALSKERTIPYFTRFGLRGDWPAFQKRVQQSSLEFALPIGGRGEREPRGFGPPQGGADHLRAASLPTACDLARWSLRRASSRLTRRGALAEMGRSRGNQLHLCHRSGGGRCFIDFRGHQTARPAATPGRRERSPRNHRPGRPRERQPPQGGRAGNQGNGHPAKGRGREGAEPSSARSCTSAIACSTSARTRSSSRPTSCASRRRWSKATSAS